MKINSYYLKCDVLKTGCWIVWPVTGKTATKWFKDKFGVEYEFELLDTTSDACAVLGTVPIIFLTKWQNTNYWISNLVHECIHISNFILQSKGIQEKDSCDEMLAYLVGFLVEGFLEALKKKR